MPNSVCIGFGRFSWSRETVSFLKVAEQNKNSYGDQTIPEAKPFWVNANFDEEHLDSSHVVAKRLVGYNFLKKNNNNGGYRTLVFQLEEACGINVVVHKMKNVSGGIQVT